MRYDFSRLTDDEIRRAYRREERALTYTMESELRRCYAMQELQAEAARRGFDAFS